MRNIIYRVLLVGLSGLLLLTAGTCQAGIESNQKSIKGPFANGVSYLTQDKRFADAGWSSYTTKSMQSTVALRVLDNVLINSAFTYTTVLSIQYYTSPVASPVTVTANLTVNYAPGQGIAYKGLDTYVIPANAYEVIVMVTGSTATGTVPANSVQLSTGIVIDRTYPFTPTVGIGAGFTIADNQKQLRVSWNKLKSADEYDAEWTTINNGNSDFSEISAHASESSVPGDPVLSDALERAFRNNASRVTTPDSTLSISMLSTDSLMLVRIRQVQYDPVTGIRIAGNWDYKNGTHYAIWLLNWNEQKQNWQYSAAFAEDGKKKEVISYFDGTLRGRQTVTLNNTDDVAVAQENIYDDFGRPSASILPSPYKEPSLIPYLHYLTNFNRNASNTPYTFANVSGTTAAACELDPDPLNVSAGASRYYSSSNDFIGLSLANRYIPDAAGYPLSVTQYTNDNTGRIKSQGGVGLTFQPGKLGSPMNSKTTKYYYGKPEQWELDQLFANDAGYAEHYLKNMVIDPNGQISVSYLNASGKTVATALTGKVPAMLDSLPSYTPLTGTTKATNIHLLKPSQFVYNSSALTLEANTTYLASVTGVDTLKFDIQKLINHYPGSFTICSNCYYKMTVKVSNDCGDTVAIISTPVKIGDTVSTCTDTTTYRGKLTVPIASIGEYNVNITFAFDNNVIQTYTDTFIKSGINNGYIEDQFAYIKKRYLDSINVSGCYADCHTCNTLLGGRTDFMQMLKVKCLALGLDSAGVTGASFSNWAGGLYDNLKNQCNALQAGCSYDPCSSIQDVMLADVSPGGQYALFDSNGNALEPAINVLTEILPGATEPNWRVKFPILSPSDTVYKSHQFTLPDGTVTSPNDVSFNIPQLIQYWQPSWASRFLAYHPENCKLMFCGTVSAYESWDMRVQQDFNTAASVSSIPVSGTPLSYNHSNAADWLMAGDPLFQPGGYGYKYRLKMKADLVNYSTNVLGLTTISNKGLMAFDDYTLYCQDPAGTTNTHAPIADNWNNCTPNDVCRVADREWTAYRQHYFELKQKYYSIMRDSVCGGPSCPVGQPVTTGLPGAVCPVPADFNISLYGDCSGQDVLITYNPGALAANVTVQIYYPALYDVPSLPHLVSFSKGDSQQHICIPAGIPVDQTKVNAVYCGEVPTYGNDSTYVVKIIDETGGTAHDPCGIEQSEGVHNIRVELQDALGNPVIAANDVTVRIEYTILPCTGPAHQITVTHTITKGQSSGGRYYYIASENCIGNPCNFAGQSIHCVEYLENASKVSGAGFCPVSAIVNTPPPSAACAAYQAKTPRFPDYKFDASGFTDTTTMLADTKAAIATQAADICTANADGWIHRLQPGLDDVHATDTQISDLRSAFIAICSAGGDVGHPMGANSLPAGTTGPYADFGAAIKHIVLGDAAYFTKSLNPWLIDAPYPYNVKQQSVAQTVSATNTSLCTLLGTLQAAATGAGQTLYNYLVSKYGSAMTLASADVDALTASCTSCRFILAHDVTLPVFLDPGAVGCITHTAYTAAKADLLAAFGGTLTDTAANYPQILSSYMNQKWGFSLTYDNYTDFEAGSATQLCNTLPYTSVDADPYDCIKNAVATAVNSGLADYAVYLALQREKFRTAYLNTCQLAKANASLVAVQQVYHYTLYQYDQADNLVRTIPPEGVHLMDASLFNYIDHVRDVDTLATVSYNYNGPRTAANLSDAMTALSATLSAGSGSVEMWLYNGSLGHYHWVEVTPDRKYLFQVAIAGSMLNIDIYPLIAPAPGSVRLVPVSRHFRSNISTLLPLYPFTHVVLQGDSLGTGKIKPHIYLNGNGLFVDTTGNAPAAFGFTIKADSASGSVIYPDSIQSLKHLRLYNNHILSGVNIIADAADNYFSAYDLGYAGWYRFNIPAAGAPPTTVNGTTDESTNVDIYPQHTLPTTYLYNATNQVSLQRSPDGGTNRFWYDLLSRLVISQNDKQNPGHDYSYTTYDPIGRITEVGQKNQATVGLGNPDYLADATISSFNAAGANSQITHTYYDAPVPTLSGHTNGIATLPGQSNLRKRVAASTYADTQSGPVLRATYYNYDLDGNVKTLWQQVDGLYVNSTNAGLKRIDYEYDLVSGKVNFVRYQDGQPDAFYYKYSYDADNRLTEAHSSTIGLTDTLTGSYLPDVFRKRDAKYSYYLHGPLARTVLGNDSADVQGVDYAYTLQGWLKGVNSIPATASADIGQDGADLGHKVARDAYGYSLGYYTNDYAPIGGSSYNAFALKYTAATGDITGQSLYNGNISNTTLAISAFSSGAPVGYTYHYDQLNRLKKTRQHTGISGTSWNRNSITLNYQENATYDGNGNILTYGRNGAAPTSQTIDSLTYNYNRDVSGNIASNKLNYIHDAISNSLYTGDLVNQNANNYSYDATGNLIQDNQAGITGIAWSVYGKIDTITKTSGSIVYTYNPAGQRVSKTAGGITTYYIRDAQGNSLAIYDNAHSQINWKEQHLYGSSRLGIWQPNVNLAGADAMPAWDTTGHKQYELSNHLGNVLATISDKRLQHTGDAATIDYYNADLGTAQDYYPFGMLQPGRQYNAANYRYGFNGKENDNEVKGTGNQQDYGMRIYDPRVGRFLSVDPLTISYPWYTPYQFSGNSPIANIDRDGGEPKPVNPGTAEGQAATTSASKYSGGGEPYPVSQTWKWYSGNIPGHGPAGWFTEDQYKLIRQDWEHGQVMLPFEKSTFGDDPYRPSTGEIRLPAYGRNWNGYQVGKDGYLTGKKYEGSTSVFANFNLFEWIDGAGELRVLGALSEGRAFLKEGDYFLYLGEKNGVSYIGSTTDLAKRYTQQELRDLGATMFDFFRDNPGVRIPNQGIAIGFEQLVIKLNNAGENISRVNKGLYLSNKINAAVKEVYISEALKWANKNIPNWEVLFKIK